ncbi:hypothetical protein [Clostridium baratii]|uniref:hypothetical protein n=1 Tax=Clostridium baratii TaxID=1561 RepID=UPI0030D24C19
MFCREWNGYRGLKDIKCYHYDVNNKTLKGICRLGNFEFDIPQIREELVDGRYVICDKCPILLRKIKLKYEEVKYRLGKVNTFKECLKLINDFIQEKYLVNSYIEFLTEGRIENLSISKCEKQYLLNKIEGFRYVFLKEIGKGKYNIFKVPKCLWDYQLITFYNYGVSKEKQIEDLIQVFKFL